MSNQDKNELRKEINSILGFDFQSAVETMLQNLEDGILTIPAISDEQKQRIRQAKARWNKGDA